MAGLRGFARPAAPANDPSPPRDVGDLCPRGEAAAPPAPPRWRSSNQGHPAVALGGRPALPQSPARGSQSSSHLAGRLRLPRGMVGSGRAASETATAAAALSRGETRRRRSHPAKAGAGLQGHAPVGGGTPPARASFPAQRSLAPSASLRPPRPPQLEGGPCALPVPGPGYEGLGTRAIVANRPKLKQGRQDQAFWLEGPRQSAGSEAEGCRRQTDPRGGCKVGLRSLPLFTGLQTTTWSRFGAD